MAKYPPGDPDREAFGEGGLEEPVVTQGSGIDWWDVDPDVQREMDRLRGEFRNRDDVWLVDSEGNPSQGYAFTEHPHNIPEPDPSIANQARGRYHSAEPLIVNDREAAQAAKRIPMFTAESIKEGFGGVKAGVKGTAESLSKRVSEYKPLHEGIGQKISWMKSHKLGTGAAIVAGGLIHHHYKHKLSQMDRQSSTIATGNQHRPAGSAAGLKAAPSAYIQMNGSGYDNPANQGARYGTTVKPPLRPPRMSRPTGQYVGSSDSVADYRRNSADQDTQLSGMI